MPPLDEFYDSIRHLPTPIRQAKLQDYAIRCQLWEQMVREAETNGRREHVRGIWLATVAGCVATVWAIWYTGRILGF